MTFKEKLIEVAKEEWEFFGKQEILKYENDNHGNPKPVYGRIGHRETENGYYQRVGKYWKTGVNKSLDGRNDDQPWSAAFISYLMKMSEAGTYFLASSQHSVYIRKSIVARQQNNNAYGFWGYRISEYKPEVGDLICYVREDAVGHIDYDTNSSNYTSHSDLVVEKEGNILKVIGGNVEDSVTMKHVIIDDNGYLTDTSKHWFVIMKNMIPDKIVTSTISIANTTNYLVTGDGVRIRKTPEKSDDNKIGILFKGDRVNYIETSTDNQWAKIKFGDLTGWSSRQYLVPIQ